MADAFGHWLERVLGDRGLIVYDAPIPRRNRWSRDVFVRELARRARRPGWRRGGRGLVSRGYHSQVHTRTTAWPCSS